jgi:alpha-L-rhamnosidase
MEAWDMKYKPNSDWNHAWGAVPANIIPGYMWGIAPAEPGYKKAIIKPQLSNLRYSKISVPTIKGNIEAEYKVTGKSKQYLVTIPANMECDFVLPYIKGESVSLNSKKVASGRMQMKLDPGLNTILIKSAN